MAQRVIIDKIKLWQKSHRFLYNHTEVVVLVSYFLSVVYFSIYHQKEIVINDPLYQCIGNDKGHTPETGKTTKINVITF